MVPAQQRLHVAGRAGPELDDRLVEPDQLAAVERALELRLGDGRLVDDAVHEHPPTGLARPVVRGSAASPQRLSPAVSSGSGSGSGRDRRDGVPPWRGAAETARAPPPATRRTPAGR